MTTPTGPTVEELEAYGEIGDDDPTVEVALDIETTSARVELTFEQTDLLAEAGELVGESPIAFMRNAALARAAEVLAANAKSFESPAAGGS